MFMGSIPGRSCAQSGSTKTRRRVVARRRKKSLFDDVNREFGAVGLGQIRLVFEAGRNDAVADLVGVAELVELEQFARKRLATGVTLTLVGINAQSELTGHCNLPCMPTVRPVAIDPAIGHSDRIRFQRSPHAAAALSCLVFNRPSYNITGNTFYNRNHLIVPFELPATNWQSVQNLPGILPTRQRRSQETTVALLEAGAEALRSCPFDELSINDLCAKVGATIGAFYGRFESKDAFFNAMVELMVRQCLIAIDTALSDDAIAGATLSDLCRQ